jgi:hypothetical protein
MGPRSNAMLVTGSTRAARGLYAKMADLGLCSITIPEEYVGSPADEISVCIVAEELARAGGCLVYAHIPTVTFCAKGIVQFGSDDQKKHFLPPIAAGTMRLAMGPTEPDAGSDLAHLSTRRRAGRGRLRGEWPEDLHHRCGQRRLHLQFRPHRSRRSRRPRSVGPPDLPRCTGCHRATAAQAVRSGNAHV